MARLTAAGDLRRRRPAPARLPSSRAATNTFIASMRSKGSLSLFHLNIACQNHPHIALFVHHESSSFSTPAAVLLPGSGGGRTSADHRFARSEEHTSELQSQSN